MLEREKVGVPRVTQVNSVKTTRTSDFGRTKVPPQIRIAGGIHLVALFVFGVVFLPSVLWPTCAFLAAFWILFVMGSYDALRGRHWGIQSLIVLDSIILVVALALVGLTLKEIAYPKPVMDHGLLDGGALRRDIAMYLVLPFTAGFLLLSGGMLVWTLRIKWRYFNGGAGDIISHERSRTGC